MASSKRKPKPELTESALVASAQPCDNPKCLSSDAKAYYDDGHSFCFSCQTRKNDDPLEGSSDAPRADEPDRDDADWFPRDAEAKALTSRGIDEETCRRWGYLQGKFKGKPAQFAIYRNAKREPVKAKVRMPDKEFAVIGDTKSLLLYGQHIWPNGGRKLIITEGELDAMSVSMAQSHRYPVVSIPNGAQGAAKALKANYEWVNSFEQIVLWFDQDQPGIEAVAECAPLFPPGKVYAVRSDLKDANEYVQESRTSEIINCIFRAEQYRPDGIVRVRDVRAKILATKEVTLPWCWDELTQLTFGRRYGESYGIGAGTGIGKSDAWLQQAAYDLKVLEQKVGFLAFEQDPAEVVTRLLSKMDGVFYTLPEEEGGYTKDTLAQRTDELDATDLLYLNDHFGVADWDVVEERIRFLARAEGVRLFYLDHLTALATGGDREEKEELEKIMARIGALVKELGIIIHFVSHLTTPEGKSHEEGGRVTIKQFKGSRAIGFWAHFLFGLERNQQDGDEEERLRTYFRILKDRFTGRSTGKVITLKYNTKTGLLGPDTDFESDAF
jgi:twinkle protein